MIDRDLVSSLSTNLQSHKALHVPSGCSDCLGRGQGDDPSPLHRGRSLCTCRSRLQLLIATLPSTVGAPTQLLLLLPGKRCLQDGREGLAAGDAGRQVPLVELDLPGCKHMFVGEGDSEKQSNANAFNTVSAK